MPCLNKQQAMIEIKRENGTPVKVFAKTFEHEAYDQVKALANYAPYNDSTIRIMPDAHAGAGCTIGTTMTLHGKVTPNLVGVDIGCGMLVVELGSRIRPDYQFLADSTSILPRLRISMHWRRCGVQSM